MRGKKVDTSSIFILKINELVCVSDIDGVMFGNFGLFNHKYYTIAKEVKDGVYRDLLTIRQYKEQGSFGYGVIRDIEERISIKDIDLQIDGLTYKELLKNLKQYLKKYNDNQTNEAVKILSKI